jgi:hypothetical protein
VGVNLRKKTLLKVSWELRLVVPWGEVGLPGES